MTTDADSSCPLGFLSIVELEDGEYSGGLLVVNPSGRPVEFHCTAPAKPNKAQQILYGPTLRPYLFGEQIAPTLIQRAKSKLAWVATDQPDVLAAARGIEVPIVLLETSTNEADDAASDTEPAKLSQQEFAFRIDAAHDPRPHLAWRTVARSEVPLMIAASCEDEHRKREDLLARHPYEGELREPFERIREAIEETLQSGR